MTGDLMKTPLWKWHSTHGGRMVDFAGWSMPVQYASIVAEHRATRCAAGIFDISHMGRLRFDGQRAAEFLDRVLTRRVVGLGVGKIRYALVTNTQGGILDDVLVYHLHRAAGGSRYALVVNASNRLKLLGWLTEQGGDESAVGFSDETSETAMIAVQGPRALEIVDPLVEPRPSGLGYYTGAEGRIVGHAGVVSRTGYTGEDGCELIVAASAGPQIWRTILDAGAGRGIQAAGLGARDTLRLEAGMPLYGHELSEQINPFQAGLEFAVHLDGHEFVGREALVLARDDGQLPRRVALELEGRRIAREGCPVLRGAQQVGHVTSGTFSPTLERSIAMAYVRPEVAELGTRLEVEIRGRVAAARVVPLPFYRRP